MGCKLSPVLLRNILSGEIPLVGTMTTLVASCCEDCRLVEGLIRNMWNGIVEWPWATASLEVR